MNDFTTLSDPTSAASRAEEESMKTLDLVQASPEWLAAVVSVLLLTGCADEPKPHAFFGDTERTLRATAITLKCINEMLDYTRDKTWAKSLSLKCRQSEKCLYDHLEARDKECQKRHEST